MAELATSVLLEAACQREATPVSPLETRPFQCPRCSSCFKRPEHLKRHQRSHEQSKRFACAVCSKKFTRSDILAKHSLIHTHPARLAELIGSESGGNGARKRQRACFECARVREKCTKGQPCSRCLLRHLSCAYPAPRPSTSSAGLGRHHHDAASASSRDSDPAVESDLHNDGSGSSISSISSISSTRGTVVPASRPVSTPDVEIGPYRHASTALEKIRGAALPPRLQERSRHSAGRGSVGGAGRFGGHLSVVPVPNVTRPHPSELWSPEEEQFDLMFGSGVSMPPTAVMSAAPAPASGYSPSLRMKSRWPAADTGGGGRSSHRHPAMPTPPPSSSSSSSVSSALYGSSQGRGAFELAGASSYHTKGRFYNGNSVSSSSLFASEYEPALSLETSSSGLGCVSPIFYSYERGLVHGMHGTAVDMRPHSSAYFPLPLHESRSAYLA